MTIEQKVARPYKIKLYIWAAIVSILCVVCILYHTFAKAQFAPAITVALVMFVSFILFSAFGLLGYYTDKGFSGEIADIKVDVKYHKESSFDRKITTRIYVGMTVNCDNGSSIFYDQIIPAHLGNKIPYKVGDRVYHIKGSKHTCRFPREDTAKKHDPVSVICPLCGAILPLGSKECAFCESDLPWDPRVK